MHISSHVKKKVALMWRPYFGLQEERKIVAIKETGTRRKTLTCTSVMSEINHKHTDKSIKRHYKYNNGSLKVGQRCSSHDRDRVKMMIIINNAWANKAHSGWE